MSSQMCGVLIITLDGGAAFAVVLHYQTLH